MKNLYILVIFLCGCFLLQAQAPQGVQYQAIARDAVGTPLPSTNLDVRFSIRDASNTVIYREAHTVTTDIFGLFEATIGQGTASLGSFPTINWGAAPHSVDIEINSGAGYNLIGNTAFQSVPYALYAERSGSDSLWQPTPAGEGISFKAGRVGIGRSTLNTTLHLADTSNVLIGDSTSGSGFKLMYYGAKGAFRCGYLDNPFGGYNYDKFWDYDSVGYYSFAAGRNSRAKGFGAFAFGSFGWADGSGSVAFFGNASGNNSFTFGGASRGRGSITFEGTAEEEGGIAMYGYTGGRYGVSIGGGTTGLGASSSRQDYAVAIGWNSDARGQASIALGPSDAYGYNSFSTGWVTEARGNYSSTFGYRTNSYPYSSMALGRYNVITGDSAAWISTDPIFIIGDGTSNTARSNSFTILKNGCTSVGYNSPTGRLHVAPIGSGLNNSGTLDLTNATLLLGTTTYGMAFDQNQIEGFGSRFNLNYNSAEDISLGFGGGQVIIGTSVTPTDRLHVSAAVGEDALRVQVGGTTRLRVHDNGGVSIGSNTGTTAAGLYVHAQTIINGVLRPNVDNSFSLGTSTRRWSRVYAALGTIQTSDRRFKKNIYASPYGIASVMKLRPVQYEWRNPVQEGKYIGLIAQELQSVVPEAVEGSEDSDEPMGVDYASLVPVLIKAVQEQQNQIDAQQREIEKLKAQLIQVNKR